MSYPSEPSSWPDPSPPPDQSPYQYPVPPPPPAVAPTYPGTGPPGYGYGGYPPPRYPGYPPPLPKTSNLAVAAMVVSISSGALLLCGFCLTFLAIAALGGAVTGAVLGFVARRQIRERGERGDGMALAGIIVGLITAALAVVGTVLIVGIGLALGSYPFA